MMRRLLVILLCALAQPLSAAEMGGVQFDSVVKGGDAAGEMQLNGVALHRLYGFQVYAIGLYLSERSRTAEAAIDSDGPKRIRLDVLREITAAQLSTALSEGIVENHTAAEVEKFKPRMVALDRVMQDIGKVGRGTRIALDWVPKVGTRIVVDGKARGEPIAGEDFYRALMRIWLGARPVSDNLKQGMLGKGL
ncbi:MAG: chalcone isomerase family protein [Proteobacteria bacterium]|nr:chalcone isomerase family protein [Burkholderiales bacterium]